MKKNKKLAAKRESWGCSQAFFLFALGGQDLGYEITLPEGNR
ncbi:hypothetical protein [Desulfofalx alkaliphila]|nr:hypothetical protein [Desulfofalx alkaliphila]